MDDNHNLLAYVQEPDLFMAPDGNCYATVTINGVVRTLQIRGTEFAGFIRRSFYDKNQQTPTDHAVKRAVDQYEAWARYGVVRHPVFIRVAGHDGRIYLDLADDQGQCVEVDAQGWRVITNPPVRFLRPPGMLPLPVPQRGGSIEELRPFINVEEERDFVVIVGFLLGSLRPAGPFALLELVGEQGSAKSTTARMIKSLIDPNSSPLRAEPSSERDLAISANNSWMPAWDNISRLPDWMSDSLCRLATGGGFSTRALYTDSDEKTFQLTRPAILTGIGEVAVRGDLLDRMIVVRLPRLTGSRRPEADIRRDFETAQPRILGCLLDATSFALACVDETQPSKLPRLADFGKWVTAAEPMLGWAEGTFLEAYFANQEEANGVVLEGSLVASAALRLAAEPEGWEGTATELLHRVTQDEPRGLGLPKTPQSMRLALERLVPNLRQAGVDVFFTRVGKEGKRMIYIRKSPESVSGVSRVSEEAA